MNFIDSLWNSRARILFRGSRFKPSIKWYKSYVEKNRENPQVVVFLLLLAPKTIVALSNCLENYFVKVSRNTLFVSNYGTRASKLRGEKCQLRRYHCSFAVCVIDLGDKWKTKSTKAEFTKHEHGWNGAKYFTQITNYSPTSRTWYRKTRLASNLVLDQQI